MLHHHWPLFGLRLTTPELELRLPTDVELGQLADVVADGIVRPGTRPFLVPWPYAPPAERARTFLARQWGDRAGFTASSWSLDLAVFRDGEPVGMQEISAVDFAVLRQVSTFSWLGLAHQGQGIGTQMRAAVLRLAFEGLMAAEATSGAFDDNGPSLAVSARLGYTDNGIERAVRDGRATTSRRLRLSRGRWESWPASREVPVTMTGLADCLPMLGLRPADLANEGDSRC